MSQNINCIPSPCSLCFRDPFELKEDQKIKYRILNTAWFSISLALIILGSLSITQTLPFGIGAGALLTSVGSLSMLIYLILSCISFKYKALCCVAVALSD